MSKQLTDHIVEGKCANLSVEALDAPGPGGACHHYFIGGYHTATNPSADSSVRDETALHILFQHGPIGEDGNGVNGIQHEAILAVLIDRLRGFQSGEYRCRENAIALTHLEESLMWMQKRTRDRISRDVEGTHKQ